jgi:hypothetical protein
VSRLNPKFRRSLIATHRFFGQAAAFVVILLALTGLALNHEEDFEFLKGTVSLDAILNLYGLEPQGEWVHYQAGPHGCTSLERGIYLDGRYLTATETPLIGVVRFQRFLAFASPNRLLLVDSAPTMEDERPQIVDQMDSASLPGELIRLGRDKSQQLIVETNDGSFRAGDDLLEWHLVDNVETAEVAWSEATEPTADQRAKVLREFRGEGLPRSRVMADLHSGRIFGRFGPAVMDASAVILLLLVITGIMGSGLGRRRTGGD